MWYRIKIRYEQVGKREIGLTYWINGIEADSYIMDARYPEEMRGDMTWLVFEAGEGPVWMDDFHVVKF